MLSWLLPVLVWIAPAHGLDDRDSLLILPGAAEAPRASAEVVYMVRPGGVEHGGYGGAAQVGWGAGWSVGAQALFTPSDGSWKGASIRTLDVRRASDLARWGLERWRVAPWLGAADVRSEGSQLQWLSAGWAMTWDTERVVLHWSQPLALVKTNREREVARMQWPALYKKHIGEGAPQSPSAVMLLPLAFEAGAGVKLGLGEVHLALPYPELSYRLQAEYVSLRVGLTLDGESLLVTSRLGLRW